MSCNLIKGFVGTREKIIDYLEFAGEIGCCDVGFVGLMPVNEFCIMNYIDMPEMTDICMSNYRECKDNDVVYCKCMNWLYQTRVCNMVSFYYRHVLGKSSKVNYMVYMALYIMMEF